ncbi:PCYCGC domain-containing protein [Halobacillus litoralis]|uniref:PCYCGC domain-containing protein n=1 Tax=Halobacillus litoralis TaxID=45668 RepID=UPI001CFE7D7A|nr:PCYCGC domain-containing protein [Halobacillus litoralis]
MKKIGSLLLIILIGTSLSGCSSETEESHIEHVHGDVREETASIEALPGFLVEKPENIQTIYAAAAQHEELLENMPCYCGCGESVGHKNNYDCFVHDSKEDGSIVWDDHGTKCGVCLEIAAQSIKQLQDGKSLEEIRKNIDDSYENGYAEPTPTPAL